MCAEIYVYRIRNQKFLSLHSNKIYIILEITHAFHDEVFIILTN